MNIELTNKQMKFMASALQEIMDGEYYDESGSENIDDNNPIYDLYGDKMALNEIIELQKILEHGK